MRAAVLALACALLSSCGGGDPAPVDPPSPPVVQPEPPEDPSVCSVSGQRLSVRGWMEEHYYWNGQMGAPDAKAAGMDAYFRSMLVLPQDRYSYSESTASFNQLFTQGVRLGYGYTLTWGDAAQTRLLVRNVEPRSPVGLAGLRRGEQVLSVDGHTPAEVAAGRPGAVTAAGVMRNFVVRSTSGATRSFAVESAEYPLTPLLAQASVDVTRDAALGGGQVKVGYLAYQQFVRYSILDLGQAMQAFARAGVQELVLDLRYNGGGDVEVARDLASMLNGGRSAGQLFAYMRFNSKHPENHQSLLFAPPQSLPAADLPKLSRLVVLTSGSTASASELLVNGLKPFLEVVLVGETTYGKPYGFQPRDWCGTNYNAVNFESFNAAGVGGYTAGLAPTCPAADDLSRALGDPQEGRLRAALDYIATGRCGAQQAQRLAQPKAAAPAAVFGEPLPEGMFVR